MTRSLFACLSLVLAGSSLIRAQGISVSQQCQNALLTVAGSPDAACLNVGGLVGIFAAGTTNSVVMPVSSWLSGVCASDACTNAQLAAIFKNVTTGCGNDLGSLGITNTNQGLTVLQQTYPVVREVGCLKNTTDSSLCLTDVLNGVQAAIGTLSVDNLIAQIPKLFLGQIPNVSKDVTCSNCAKQAYNLLKQSEPAVATASQVTSVLQSQCGASFLDGVKPANIVEGTGALATQTGNAALPGSLVPKSALLGVVLSTLTAVGSAVFIFA